jgi:hypothetical protein
MVWTHSVSCVSTLPHNAHSDEGGNGQADTGGINFRTVGANDALVFHAAHTLGNGRRGEPNTAPQFGK